MELDLKANKLIEEIVAVIRSNLDKEKLVEKLDDYHANDIAQSLEYLTKDERLSLYEILGDEWVSEILSYVEEPEQYINELGIENLPISLTKWTPTMQQICLKKLMKALRRSFV